MDQSKTPLTKNRMEKLLTERWHLQENDINNSEDIKKTVISEFLLGICSEIRKEYEGEFDSNYLRCMLIISESSARLRKDIKSDKLSFKVNNAYHIPLPVKPSFKVARDALIADLKSTEETSMSYHDLEEKFTRIKKGSPLIMVGVFDVVIHLVKHNFLLTEKKGKLVNHGDIPSASTCSIEKKETEKSNKNSVRALYERFKKLEKTKVKIEEPIEFREEAAYELDLGNYQPKKKCTEKIRITTKKEKVIFDMAVFIENDDDVFEPVTKKQDVELPQGRSYDFEVSWCSGVVGYQKALLLVVFENEKSHKEFMFIGFRAYCSNDEMKKLRPVAPYVKLPPLPKLMKNIIPGMPPNSDNERRSSKKFELKQYEVPPDVRSKVAGSTITDGELQAKLDEAANVGNYKEKFKYLLYIEEIQMQKDMRQYDMRDVRMKKNGDYLSLEVPGLAEKRPSLVIGDRVIVESAGSNDAHEGYIHIVEQERISLKFDYRFHHNFLEGQKFQVRFKFNRFTIQLQHRALENADILLREGKFPYLFMDESTAPSTAPTSDEVDVDNLRWFDKDIDNNKEQQDAIKNILKGSSYPHPYIIFGPPGTGKTVTVVEAMRQVLSQCPDSCILACATSNYAADLLLLRLLKYPIPKVTKDKYFRLNATGRSLLSIPEGLKGYCKIDTYGKRFAIPTLEKIQNFKVIVCTFTTAGRLVNEGISRDHFTHIFMDESGQATEPEMLIPLANLSGPKEQKGVQVIMAGDIKQLGSVLRSPIAIKHGLSLSLLERLMTSCHLYQRNEKCEDNYDKRYITKLINNYRSHERILEVPNKLFYDNELQAMADELKITNLCDWEGLPEKNFPIIFHGVLGKDEREKNSPSFFNASEVTIVKDYVKELLETKRVAVEPSEIGIISPYKQQVKKIRQCLAKDFKGIKVGSVEEFQGAEYRVIIISTVRSSEEYLMMDAEFKLGFLKNPKRFNVAVTRAQALLIIVGNPYVLCKDEHWKRLVNFCIENGGYKGKKYKEDSYEQISSQLKDLTLDEDDGAYMNAEAPWDRRDA